MPPRQEVLRVYKYFITFFLFSVAAFGEVPVLCLASRDLAAQGLTDLDPRAVAAYREAGFDLRFGFYQDTTAETLREYPLVVGMMPMLYPGTRVLDNRLGPALSDYIRNGGGFLLLPAPSYYGPEDYVRQLNPWLAPLGAALLNERPRDPARETTLNRVLGYRYLATTNFAPHEVTRGLTEVQLPLDFSDAFIATHTLKVDKNWNILASGETSCRTVPFGKASGGTYASEPPFLAVRDWGKGRIGLFATSSQYFLFDAYHWAFGEGFVMTNGGLRLMSQLMNYLAGPVPERPVRDAASAIIQGNTPAASQRGNWMSYVLNNLKPAGFRVAAYIDSGSLSDQPFSDARGYGFVAGNSWPLRWFDAELLHVTAANARGFDSKPLVYRFTGLSTGVNYRIGLLRWAWQPEGARDLRVWDQALPVPRYDQGQGPFFQTLEVPKKEITDVGTLDIEFSRGNGGAGSYTSVGELWLFAEGGETNQTADELRAQFQSPANSPSEPLSDHPLRAGLIGARSTLSGGSATVADLASAAREEGLDFLAFTEDSARLDDDGLRALQEECMAVSTDTFRALPGVKFTGRYAEERQRRTDLPFSWGDVSGTTFSPLQRLPTAEERDNAYNLFWKFFGGEYGGGAAAVPTFHDPLTSAISPWFTRFWRGFEMIRQDATGAVTDDARQLYADLLDSGYGPQPRTYAVLDSVAAVRAVAASGWRTYIPAPQMSRIEAFQYASFIGNGPVLKHFVVTSDHTKRTRAGEGLLFGEPTWVEAQAKLVYTGDLAKVVLMNGSKVVRVWYPQTPEFEIAEPLLVTENAELWLRVAAADGRECISGRVFLQDHTFMMSMCADNQNSICNLAVPPSRFSRDERGLFLAHSYWHTGEASGQIGAMRDASELVPRVIETGIIQPVKYFLPAPLLHFADGSKEDHVFAQMRIGPASRHANQIVYTFDPPGARASSRVTLTSFRPEMDGDTVVLVESTLRANEDFQLRAQDGIELLRVAMLPDLAKDRRYTWMNEQGKTDGGLFAYGEPMTPVRGHVGAQGGVMLWPSDVGSVLVFQQDGQDYDAIFERLNIWNARESVTLAASPAKMAKGEVRNQRFLVALHQGEIRSDQNIAPLRRELCELERHVREVKHGELVSRDYPLCLRAKDGVLSARFDTTTRRDPLPLEIEKLNAAGPCGLWLDGVYQAVEEGDQGPLRIALPPGRADLRVEIGAALTCDQPAIRLEYAGNGLARAHNPTANSVTFRVRSSSALPVPKWNAEYTLPPGGSAWIRNASP